MTSEESLKWGLNRPKTAQNRAKRKKNCENRALRAKNRAQGAIFYGADTPTQECFGK